MDAMSEAIGAVLMILLPMFVGCCWIVCSNLLHERARRKRIERREAAKCKKLG